MNKLVFVALAFLCSISTDAQNFIGEIKYVNSSISQGIKDTLIYYFDKDFVVVEYGKTGLKRGGARYSIYVLPENKNFIFDSERGWFELPSNPNMIIKSSTPDSIGTEIYQGYSCVIYEKKKEIRNANIRVDDQHTIWASKDFIFELPKEFTLVNNIFANGTGRIALKTEIFGSSDVGTHDSSSIASSIIPKLSKKYYEILTNFQKWYNK